MGKFTRRIKGRSRHMQHGANGIAETALEGMGKRMWSDQHQQLMSPSKGRRIAPTSDEGLAITQKYLSPRIGHKD